MRHATTSSRHFSLLFLFLSWRRNRSRGKFKSGLKERRRCESLSMALLPKILSHREKAPSVFLKFLMSRLSKWRKTCLPSVYSLVLGLHGLDSQSWASLLSCPLNLRAIDDKVYTEENTCLFPDTIDAVCPHCEYLDHCILLKFQVCCLLSFSSFPVLFLS